MHTEPRGHNGRYSDQVMLMVTLVLSVCVLAACGGPSHSASNPQSRSTGTTAERRVSTAASQTVYVTMLGVQVVPIDVQTNRPQSPIYTTSAGLIAITSNGMTAYVGLGSQVTAIDLATKSVGTSITVPGNDLSALALSSDDKTLYVLSGDVHQESAEFVAVNLLTDKVELSAAVPGDPEAVVISPSGTAAYLADNQDAEVIPVNLSNFSLGTPIAISGNPYSLAITMIPQTTYVHESVLSHRVGFVLIERGDRQRVPRRCLSGIYIDCDDLARIALCPCRLSFNSARRFHEW